VLVNYGVGTDSVVPFAAVPERASISEQHAFPPYSLAHAVILALGRLLVLRSLYSFTADHYLIAAAPTS
jgi:hypothetical protein